MNHTTPRTTTIGNRRQLLVLTGTNLVGLDPESGRELWRHPQRGVNCASPVVGPNNQIFTAASYGFGCQLVKVDDGTVTQVYKNNVLATHHATAMLYQDHLYGFHDRPGIFKCVEFATGKEKWVSRSPGKGKLIIADGQMIVITETGELVLSPVSPDGFKETSKARVVKGTCYTAPSLANGKLYVRSNQEMVCIEMRKLDCLLPSVPATGKTRYAFFNLQIGTILSIPARIVRHTSSRSPGWTFLCRDQCKAVG